LLNTKRLGRYHNYNHSVNNNTDNHTSPHFSDLAQIYKDINRKPLLDLNKPLFGSKRNSLQKVLANANKTTEKSTKFINKIKSRELACANRASFKKLIFNKLLGSIYVK
jgi:hypothetical protein